VFLGGQQYAAVGQLATDLGTETDEALAVYQGIRADKLVA
jgi:hypothetical protein